MLLIEAGSWDECNAVKTGLRGATCLAVRRLDARRAAEAARVLSLGWYPCLPVLSVDALRPCRDEDCIFNPGVVVKPSTR